jgi:transcription initiation factor TFIIB
MCSDGQMVTDPEWEEVICRYCGIVMMDKIQESRPEWRAFTSDYSNNIRRTGTPSSFARHGMSLSTVIGRVDKDANGNRIDISMRSPMDRVRDRALEYSHIPLHTEISEKHSASLKA